MQKIFNKARGVRMRGIIFSIVFLMLIAGVYAGFCCRDPVTLQKKCYDTGECCTDAGIWYPSCYDFEIGVSGERSFKVGEKSPVIVYITNKGSYADSYGMAYEIISTSPNLILVDMTGAALIKDINPGETKRVYPQITILSSTATGKVIFTAASQARPAVQKSAELYILESDNYLSLPEFSILGFLSLILLVGIFRYISIKRRSVSL